MQCCHVQVAQSLQWTFPASPAVLCCPSERCLGASPVLRLPLTQGLFHGALRNCFGGSSSALQGCIRIRTFSVVNHLLLWVQISHFLWFMNMSHDKWLHGGVTSYAIGSPSATQYWLEYIGLWLAVDFEIQAPFLFAFAARGSLVNSYLGISFGTIIKWHRYGAISCHAFCSCLVFKGETKEREQTRQPPDQHMNACAGGWASGR